MTRALRLVTLPARHAYVDAVLPSGIDHVDTRPTGPTWAPDPLWDPRAWARRAADVDVVHVHFGFDHVAPDVLREWVDVTRAYRVRLVLTVHDLRNPHHRDPSLLDAQLAVLVGAADAVLTLTPGAAAVLAERFGRQAVVVEHPAVFDGPADTAREPGLVGVHLKSFRANVGDDVVPALQAVAREVAAGHGRLRIDVHTDVAADPRTVAVREAFAEVPNVAVCTHDRFDDEQLRRYLTTLSVSVQLHRWGTHSGWVEACHDVGTAVVSPAVGFLAEQWPAVREYPTLPGGGADLGALAEVVAVAVTADPPSPASRTWRRQQTADLHALHRAVYAA